MREDGITDKQLEPFFELAAEDAIECFVSAKIDALAQRAPSA